MGGTVPFWLDLDETLDFPDRDPIKMPQKPILSQRGAKAGSETV